MVIKLSGKNIKIENLFGDEFYKKNGFKCPIGVMGRRSDNKLFQEKMNWSVSYPLEKGMEKTYEWVLNQVKNKI
jgi:nucleoside-diphosphate-sugar epimerase